MPELPDDPPGQSFPPQLRVRNDEEYRRVFELGGGAADGTLVVLALANGLGFTRLGVVVSRQVGNSVVRHRWKRVVREAFRTRRKEIPVGFDLVVRPKRGAVCDSNQIQRSLVPMAKKAIARIGQPKPTRAAQPTLKKPPAKKPPRQN